jgi:hypothetical protein
MTGDFLGFSDYRHRSADFFSLGVNYHAAPVGKKTVRGGSKARLDEKSAMGYLTACSCPLPPHISRRPIWDIRKP